jgi:hypothetical protein
VRITLLIVVFLTHAAAAEETAVRDWTIEKPAVAGLLSGLTLGFYDGFDLGANTEEASVHDPYGMTPTVREELIRLGGTPHVVGRCVGSAGTLLLFFGVLFRGLNTLITSRPTQVLDKVNA